MPQEQKIENQQQAVMVLVQAAQLAQKRGAFDLTEASLISHAVHLFVPDPTPEVNDNAGQVVEEAPEASAEEVE